jgi:hypothetical protein
VSDEKAVRYPARADSLAQLEALINDCPPWAVGKFAVFYQGKTLDYGKAANLVAGNRDKVGR